MSTQKDVVDTNLEYLSEILGLIKKGVDKFTPTGFVKNLRSLIIRSELSNDNIDYLVEFILTNVVEEWRAHRIKKKDLFRNKNRGEVTRARKMAIILMKQHTKLSDQKIGDFFDGRVRQVIYKTFDEFNMIDPKTKVPHEIDFLNKHHAITARITQYVENLRQAEK